MTGKILKRGVMGKNYHQNRKIRSGAKYRLERRALEVIKAINLYHPKELISLLDVGTADGLMLSKIKKKFPKTECLGLEYSHELICCNKDKNIKIIQGDAHSLPFPDNYFDAIISTAVIEHLSYPLKALEESYRVLKEKGILILTTPDPFFERIAQILGYLKEEDHQETFNLQKIKEYMEKARFKILQANKFMVSPIGFPYEIRIERALRFLKLDFILLNQLVVGKK